MPLPLLGLGLLLGGISAAGSVAGSLLGASAQDRANAQNLEIAKMQNAWNLEQWNRENQYNRPTEQMQRLSEAGLNPNLVYGNGATTQAAASPRAAGAKMEAFKDYNFGLQDATSTYLNSLNTEKNLELAQSQKAALDAQTLHESVKQTETLSRKNLNDFQLGLAKQTEQYSVEAAKLNAERTRTEIQRSITDNAIKEYELRILQPLQGKVSEQQLQNLKAQGEMLIYQGQYEQIKTALAKQGINMNDPIWVRQIDKFLNGLIGPKNLESVGSSLRERYLKPMENNTIKLPPNPPKIN